MKVGWQLKEEVPLMIIIFVIVTALMKYMGSSLTLSVGTGFFIAAVITSLEVIIHALQRKRKEVKPAPKKTKSKTKRKSSKKKK